MTRRDIPNLLTVGRILLALPLVAVMVQQRFSLALGLFALAGVSDGVDGLLARRYRWTSRLGAILDPLADKVLLVTSFLTLGWLGVLPAWLVTLVIVRDLIIVGGALAYHVLIGTVELRHSLLSKFNTFMQIVLVLTVVVAQVPVALPAWTVPALVYTVVITTVASGADYVWVWGWRAWERREGNRHDDD